MTGSVAVSWPLVDGNIVPTPLQQAAELSAQCEATFAQPEGSGERCTVTIELPDEVPMSVSILLREIAQQLFHAADRATLIQERRPCVVQVSEVCILSTARICEVSAGSRGGSTSYVCSVRASPAANGDSAMHLLTISEPVGTAQVLQLKMLSLEQKTQWRITGLGFRRAAAPLPKVSVCVMSLPVPVEDSREQPPPALALSTNDKSVLCRATIKPLRRWDRELLPRSTAFVACSRFSCTRQPERHRC